MRKSIPTFFASLLALALFSSPVLAAPKSQVKEKGHLTLTVALAPVATVPVDPTAPPAEPAPEAPVAPSGTGEITITKTKFKSAESSTLELTLSDLPAGTYSVDTVIQSLPVHLGDFVVAAAVPGTPATPITLAIPATVDATQITTVSISNELGIVLEGTATVTSATWKYLANVRITGSDTILGASKKGNGKSKKVSGHVISQSKVTNGVETHRHFRWVGFGAPALTALTINVDGVAVGTVTSTHNGKVSFHTMPEPVVLRSVSLVTITDALGGVVMQAQF